MSDFSPDDEDNNNDRTTTCPPTRMAGAALAQVALELALTRKSRAPLEH